MQWFFTKEVNNNHFEFDPEESKHCIRVLRLKKGDKLILTDGKGRTFSGTLVDDNPKKCAINIDKITNVDKPRNYLLQIAVSPTKNIARFEWFIEKAAEIGVDKIIPLQCEHSERIRLNHDRLEKILISAVKQSQQPWLPELTQLMTFSSLINQKIQGQRFIAYLDENHQTTIKNASKQGYDTLILIGPEGDFSKDEIKQALEAGFQPVSLGPNRLRTETAALLACHTVVLLNQQ